MPQRVGTRAKVIHMATPCIKTANTKTMCGVRVHHWPKGKYTTMLSMQHKINVTADGGLITCGRCKAVLTTWQNAVYGK